MSLCEVEVGKQLNVELDGLLYLRDFDEFVGSVAAAALTGAHLEAGTTEECLVAQGGAAVGRAAQFDGAAHEGVLRTDATGFEAHTARHDIALKMLANALQYFLVGLHFIGAHINDKGATVGHHIVLGASIDEGDGHLGGAQEGTDFRELRVANPRYVVDGMIDSIVALLSGGMSRTAVGGAVENHESAFGYGRLHACGFADECHIDVWKQGQYAFYAAGTTNFLLG